MTYIQVGWTHNLNDEPINILTELDAERYEVRKLESFRDGSVTLTGPEGETGRTWLSETPLPPNSEIAADPQFTVTVISQEAFEQSWRSATVLTAA